MPRVNPNCIFHEFTAAFIPGTHSREFYSFPLGHLQFLNG